MYPRKGCIEVGSDADLVIWNDKATRTISAKTHHHAVDFNIFEGQVVHGVPEITIAGGVVAFTRADDKFHVDLGHGKFVARKPWAPYVYEKIITKEQDYEYKAVVRPPYTGDVLVIEKEGAPYKA